MILRRQCNAATGKKAAHHCKKPWKHVKNGLDTLGEHSTASLESQLRPLPLPPSLYIMVYGLLIRGRNLEHLALGLPLPLPRSPKSHTARCTPASNTGLTKTNL